MDATLPVSCEELRDLIRRHARQDKAQASAAAGSQPCHAIDLEVDGMCEDCLLQMLPDLIRLVCSDVEQPVARFAPTIRRMIEERWFIDENGDSVVNDELEHRLDEKVHLLVVVLEEIEQKTERKGTWPKQPAAIMMCG